MKSFYNRLYEAYRRGHLGHGLLIVSSEEKLESFEKNLMGFLQALSCTQPQPQGACGQCDSCLLIQSSFPPPPHPDMECIKPESPISGYSVEQIRALQEKMALSLSLSQNRIAWLAQAEGLGGAGTSAGHAFLKALEEPRPHSFLILSTSQASALLPTIRSRCQIFRLPQEGSGEALSAQVPQGWEELLQWLQRGALPESSFSSPPDEDSFWKDRGRALSELEEAYYNLWQNLRKSWESRERLESLRLLDFFKTFEGLIQNLRAYGQPQLQWLSLRSNAKIGNLWKL